MFDARRIVPAMLVAGALVLSLTACTSSSPTGSSAAANDSGPIKVGAILSLSGQNAALGKAEKQALDLEVKRINDDGGINGRTVELTVMDDATDEAKAQAAATKLIEQDGVVAILGSSGTGQSMAIRGDVDRAGIPQISMAGGSLITQQLDPLVFQTPWPNRIVVPFVLQKMHDVGVGNIALLTDTGGYGKDGRAVITSMAPDFQMKIVADETFNPQDADMTAQLTRIKGSGADAILMWTAGKDAVTVAKNREQLGLAIPLFGGSGQARKEFVEGARTAANGFVFGTGASFQPDLGLKKDSEQYKIVTDFADRYEKAYGEQPDIFAGHAYDAINILADAIKRGGTTEPAMLRDAIEQTKGLIGFGGAFTFSPTDHNGLTEKDLFLYQVQDGKWTSAQ